MKTKCSLPTFWGFAKRLLSVGLQWRRLWFHLDIQHLKSTERQKILQINVLGRGKILSHKTLEITLIVKFNMRQSGKSSASAYISDLQLGCSMISVSHDGVWWRQKSGGHYKRPNKKNTRGRAEFRNQYNHHLSFFCEDAICLFRIEVLDNHLFQVILDNALNVLGVGALRHKRAETDITYTDVLITTTNWWSHLQWWAILLSSWQFALLPCNFLTTTRWLVLDYHQPGSTLNKEEDTKNVEDILPYESDITASNCNNW